MLKHPVRLIILWFLTPAALLLQYVAALSPQTVEIQYSRNIYPVIASVFSTISGLFPFSLAEVLLAAGVIVLIVRLILCFARLGVTGPIGLWRGFVRLGAVLSLLFFIFTLWRLNYDRLPLATDLGYAIGTPNETELTALTSQEVSAINALCPQLTWDKNGHSEETGGFDTLKSRVNDAYGRLMAASKPTEALLPHVNATPKAVFPSSLLARFHIEGIFVPFTFEPTVDTGYPAFVLPFSIAHESAHLKGFAREDEANYWAYLATCASPDVFYQYSGHITAFIYLNNALAAVNSAAATAQTNALDSRAKADLAAYNAYTQKYESGLSEAANKLNDAYLKSQGQKGVVSYDAFVTLLCDRYRTDTGI